MWLRDGWIWNHETGEKRRATAEEMELAERGEMEVADEQEKKFAAQAAGVEHVSQAGYNKMDTMLLSEDANLLTRLAKISRKNQ